MFEAIPGDLKQLPQWVLASADKQPMQINGHAASVTDGNTWATFVAIVEAHANGAQPHIGYVFSERDKYTGIDLDATDDEAIKVIQQHVFESIPSYAEISQSGKGLHIIAEGTVPRGRRRKNVEIYSSGRYFIMTGNVYRDVPIINCQPQIDALYAEMARGNIASNATGDAPQKEEDRAVYDRAMNAANGEKFNSLWQGDWSGLGYPSQSEADFALVDILAFYSPNDEQVTRMFRASALGARLKALRPDYIQYMLKRCRDRQPEIIDLEGVEIAAQIARDSIKPKVKPTIEVTASVPAPAIPPAPFKGVANPYTLPPGLMGRIAEYVYSAAPRPVPEIALAAAIGLMAGICGRSYNANGSGLNLYLLVLAPTGTGKEAIASGIDGLLQAVEDGCESAQNFRGPGAIASGPALIKALSLHPSFISVLGEWGYKFQAMAAVNAASADLSLKSILLDLHNKSGYHQAFQRSVYSQKENNTAKVQSPGFSLVCETVPSKFYSLITTDVIADGLLPRFIIIDCVKAKRTTLNPNAGHAPTEELTKAVQDLCGYSHLLSAENKGRTVLHVGITPDAKALLDEMDQYSTDLINIEGADVKRHLWNRAHLNTQRLSALVAVGCNYLAPMIEVDHVLWARNIIVHTTQMLLNRFDEGEIGSDNQDEGAQMRVFKSAARRYMEAKTFRDLPTSYRVNEKMFRAGFVSHTMFQVWCGTKPVFQNDRAGVKVAFQQILKNAIDNGYIEEILDRKAKQQVEANGRIFRLINPEQWI